MVTHYNIGNFSVTSFQTDNQLVSQASDFIYLNGQYALNLKESLVGVITLDDYIVLATHSSLVIIDNEGQIVDEIGKYTGLPENPLGISMTQDGLEGPHPKWIAPVVTPSKIDTRVQEHARSNEIHYERVLLDLHSGRLFGDWGQNIMSLAAILLLALAVTGIVIWLRKKPV